MFRIYGTPKPITEQYVVDALTFTEAESIITEEMSVYISGEFNINGIKPAPYKEIFFSELNSDDRWFKAKLQFITFDEKTQKEKRSAVNYLVQAHTRTPIICTRSSMMMRSPLIIVNPVTHTIRARIIQTLRSRSSSHENICGFNSSTVAEQ